MSQSNGEFAESLLRRHDEKEFLWFFIRRAVLDIVNTAKDTFIRRMKPDQRAVAEFVNRVFGSHDRQLHRYLQRMLGSKEAAEEVAQNAYAKLFRLVRPDEVKSPQALLFNVATKLATDYLQAERTRAAVLGKAAELHPTPDGPTPPDKQAVIDEAMQHLKKVIAQMRPNYRPVFVLRYLHQLSHQEIATRLNISADAAQQRAVAALEECRGKFAALGINPLSLD